MNLNTFSTADQVAVAGAEHIAALARASLEHQALFTLALSGGRTPWEMLAILATQDLDWSRVHFLQVDERVAPDGDADRNHTRLIAILGKLSALPARNIHPMPVTAAELTEAADKHAAELGALAGIPPIIDLVHLGLGGDGHTASLVPGDPSLDIVDRDYAVTGEYQGRLRMTMTYPLINRARHILWLVTGAEKTPMLARLLHADPSIPAGRVDQHQAVIFADQAAADGIPS